MTARGTTVLVALALVAVYGYGRAQKAAGRNEARLAQAAARVETLTVTLARTDTVYRATVRHFRSVDTLYASVRVTDTLVVQRADTTVVFIPRDVADSAVNSCRVVVASCSARVAASDSLIAGLRLNVKALEASRPNPWPQRALFFLGGATACALWCRE